ncbi:hypothetical protein [Massilia sp. CCM 8734]|uniref:hypothetical protein n=1 Tax=Massilia sp. CCM 8734 TaxID=2609283 RepID=UPI00141EE7BF|nr:hypothetical protein [Massilia sp. CCM 8734]NHZ99674.1 hypothetical protein [Massilia sp. CCM 8734]
MSLLSRFILPRLALMYGAVLLMSGCVSTTFVTDPLKLPQNSTMKPVLVSMTSNTGAVNGVNQITVQRLTEAQLNGKNDFQDTYVLMQLAPELSRDTSFFSGALPPGEYRFYAFSDTKSRKILRIPEGGRLLGNFVVKGDKAVDLGRLITTPVNANVVYGRSKLAASNRSLLQRFAPDYAQLLAGDVDNGWKDATGDAGAPGSVESYALIRPVGAQCMTELADGRLAAASRLGTVLIRSTDGRWKTVRGPGIESLLCVTPTTEPGAELVAMGEFGTLLRKPAGVDQLLPIDTGNLPAGMITRLYGSARNGWFLSLVRGTEILIFHSAALEAGNWSVVRKESIAHSIISGASNYFMWPTANGFAYTVSAGPIHFYDWTSKAWTQRPTPDNASVIGMNVSPGGVMLALTSPGGGFAGAFASIFMSRDQAVSWQPVNTPYSIKAFPPTMTAAGTLLMAGGVFSNPELQSSKDDGRTWEHVSKYELDRSVVALPSGQLIDYDYAQWGLFTIRHSKDGGKTWRVEYSNYDERAFKARYIK